MQDNELEKARATIARLEKENAWLKCPTFKIGDTELPVALKRFIECITYLIFWADFYLTEQLSDRIPDEKWDIFFETVTPKMSDEAIRQFANLMKEAEEDGHHGDCINYPITCTKCCIQTYEDEALKLIRELGNKLWQAQNKEKQ